MQLVTNPQDGSEINLMSLSKDESLSEAQLEGSLPREFF